MRNCDCDLCEERENDRLLAAALRRERIFQGIVWVLVAVGVLILAARL